MAVTLINVLKVKPENQKALIALLKQNTETVIMSLSGWKKTQLIAAADGSSVIIHSEWESLEAVQDMRVDPRMQAYFPKILELASFDSAVGEVVFDQDRKV